jgi:hypothetical protein
MMLGLLAACGDDGTSSGATTTGGGGGAGGASGAGGAGGGMCASGLEQATQECTACQDAHCCLTASAAASNPGTWTKSAAKICREANCSSECGVAEPECGGIQPSPASCTDDLYAKCCAEVTACAKSDACTALIYICIDDRGCSPGSPCFADCAAEFPGGDALFDDLNSCSSGITCM